MYHYVRVVDPKKDPLGYQLSVTPQDFAAQMAYLKSNGYTTITPDGLWQAMQDQTTLPSKSVLLTFDDGYSDFYSAAFPVLKKENFNATAFIITDFLGDAKNQYMTWAQVKQLDSSGLITIGSHTLHHVNVATSKNAVAEIDDSKTMLTTFLGHPITTFAYPGGSFNNQAVDLVDQASYEMAFTTQPGLNHTFATRLTQPRVRISGGMSLSAFITRINGRG
jgi:peptidoglycan/xylan/chitin deacetylase (PgdA/CDA1 family)